VELGAAAAAQQVAAQQVAERLPTAGDRPPEAMVLAAALKETVREPRLTDTPKGAAPRPRM